MQWHGARYLQAVHEAHEAGVVRVVLDMKETFQLALQRHRRRVAAKHLQRDEDNRAVRGRL